MRVFMSAGEASADALGASLIAELRRRSPDLEVFGMGGPAMRAQGMTIWRDATELNVVGLIEVLRHLPRLFRLLWDLADRGVAAKPDLAILIDAPDFNVRLARYFHRANIRVAYYVGPSVWAWRSGRAKKFARVVDKMLVLFPFELSAWSQAGLAAVCVGHPLADEITKALVPQRHTIAILPGSRRSEVARHLGLLLEAGAKLVNEGHADRLVLPVAPTLDASLLQQKIDLSPARGLVDLVLAPHGDPGPRRNAVAASRLALVCSGTATLEVALLGTPSVIVYRVSPLSWWIGRRMTKLEHLGLPNLLMGRSIVPELLQDALSVESLIEAAKQVLADPDTQRKDLAEMRAVLGAGGASARAADAVLQLGS